MVGTTIYSSDWYLMDTDIQKSIWIIIFTSQNSPEITAGKAMKVNLKAYMNVSTLNLPSFR